MSEPLTPLWIDTPDAVREAAKRCANAKRIALDTEACTVCMLCARECPDWCIYIEGHKEEQPPSSPGGRVRVRAELDRFDIDYALCMYCGICVEVCPFDALFWSPEYEYSEYEMGDMLHGYLAAFFGVEALFLHGGTPQKRRDRMVDRFQLGRAQHGPPIMILSLKAGGVGLNLTAKDCVFVLDPWWNLAVEDQAADDETVRRFRNDAQSAARLDHENIARVHYVGEDSGWNYIVFEFIEGWYNPGRRHSALGYLSPIDYERSALETLEVSSP